MRILVCGDRNWIDVQAIQRVLSAYPSGTIVIEGGAKGADRIANNIANELGFKVITFPANWKKFGRAAGPIRNQQMLDEGKPDRVIAFHHDLKKSRGTANMVKQARKAGVVSIHVIGN